MRIWIKEWKKKNPTKPTQIVWEAPSEGDAPRGASFSHLALVARLLASHSWRSQALDQPPPFWLRLCKRRFLKPRSSSQKVCDKPLACIQPCGSGAPCGLAEGRCRAATLPPQPAPALLFLLFLHASTPWETKSDFFSTRPGRKHLGEQTG